MASLTVAEIARLCRADFEGDGNHFIQGANSLEEAGPHELSFVAHAKALASAARSSAGCLIVQADFVRSRSENCIRVPDPRLAFASVLRELYPQE